jgi:phage FluMu protein Com
MNGNGHPVKVLDQPRCKRCGKKFAEWLQGRVRYDCPRCNTTTILDSLGKGAVKSV